MDELPSAITPIGAYLPNDMTEETMESLFVGNDTAKMMVDLKDQAKEWIEAWKKAPTSPIRESAAGQFEQGAASSFEEPPIDDSEFEENPF